MSDIFLPEYKEAVKKDHEHAIDQRDKWQAKLNEAQAKLSFWQDEVKAITTVRNRLSMRAIPQPFPEDNISRCGDCDEPKTERECN